MAEPSRLAVSTIRRKTSAKFTGVLIVKVWAVVPEVFLPYLSYEMGVSAECPLMASHQHFVKKCYLPLL